VLVEVALPPQPPPPEEHAATVMSAPVALVIMADRMAKQRESNK
jgi:hypothetical protein